VSDKIYAVRFWEFLIGCWECREWMVGMQQWFRERATCFRVWQNKTLFFWLWQP